VAHTAHVVVSGEGWREAFLQRWQIPPQEVTTVENGTVLTRLLAREQLKSFREPPANEPMPTVVYLGSFQPWQGVPVLLRALKRVQTAGADARLILIGAGAGSAEAQALVDQLGLQKMVTFKGRLLPRDYAPVLAAADIGVAPYCGWPEFSGLKLFDYKAAGLAVVASGQNGHPPTLSHGETGWIVPPCDEESLALAIMTLAGDPALRRRLARAARLEAERVHDWSHTVQQLEEVFEKVLGRRADAFANVAAAYPQTATESRA
jgi:glycosyltransferase involved in cell wall biosynthesis